MFETIKSFYNFEELNKFYQKNQQIGLDLTHGDANKKIADALTPLMEERPNFRSECRKRNAKLLLIVATVGVAGTIADIAINIFHILTLYAFKENRPKGFKVIAGRIGTALTEIVSLPLFLTGFSFAALYGCLIPFTGAKAFLELDIRQNKWISVSAPFFKLRS